ncbi:MAG: TonB family protein, partial [Cyanobacteria bacterium HKST-UBA05]|nr:TonB family protein [Cyanobacteria bacterium HKST-UBA05]
QTPVSKPAPVSPQPAAPDKPKVNPVLASALAMTRGTTPSPDSSPSMASVPSIGHVGSVANPSPGNPHAPSGIDAKRQLADYGPYRDKLARAIKNAWKPPRDNRNRDVVVLFRIYQDGRIEDIKIKTSSGVPASDSAAVAALVAISPFDPLPDSFTQDSITVEFTFDYNVFNGKK